MRSILLAIFLSSQKKFFNEDRKFNLLVLRPDDNFFLKNSRASVNDFSENDIFKLLKSKTWKPYHKEWNRRIKALDKTVPVIKIMMNHYSPEFNCFQ